MNKDKERLLMHQKAFIELEDGSFDKALASCMDETIEKGMGFIRFTYDKEDGFKIEHVPSDTRS